MIRRKQRFKIVLIGLISTFVVGNANSHGLVENPPARNWFCGFTTKPDHVPNGVAVYPQCGDAFASDNNGGYQFMSVLTHDRGRSSVTPLPDNVCGFNSETFNGGPTPWDQAADWPTSPMSAGQQDFTWNIEWGPHFDDTEEFKFWITTPDFQYDRDSKLAWNDFETDAFCAEQYDDSQSTANPAITALKATTQFEVSCNVPSRQGRHIIYAEWGRNQFTLERFHGCIDVVFGDETPTIPTPPIPVAATAIFDIDLANVTGSTTLELDGTGSAGNNLSYSWSVDASDATVYSIDDASAAVTTLNLENPDAAQNVTVTLTVTGAISSDSTSDTFLHETEELSAWIDLGPLTNNAENFTRGDAVYVRTVNGQGVDAFYPEPALTLDDSNTSATQWPLALANAVNAAPSLIAVGVLGDNDEVTPVADATANRVYATQGGDLVSAFLVRIAVQPVEPTAPPVEPVEPIAGSCSATVRSGNNNWWAGLSIASEAEQFTLDFSGTGMDLDAVSIDSGSFQLSIEGQLMTLTKPAWVSSTVSGYLGLHANNYDGLTALVAPSCDS